MYLNIFCSTICRTSKYYTQCVFIRYEADTLTFTRFPSQVGPICMSVMFIIWLNQIFRGREKDVKLQGATFLQVSTVFFTTLKQFKYDLMSRSMLASFGEATLPSLTITVQTFPKNAIFLEGVANFLPGYINFALCIHTHTCSLAIMYH